MQSVAHATIHASFQLVPGTPNEARVVGAAFVGLEIPIFPVRKAFHMRINKDELRAAMVKVCMDVVLLGTRGDFAVVEEVNGGGWLRDGADANGAIALAGAVQMLVHAVMEQIFAI